MWFKGIIMEIKDEYSIVMKENSEIVKVKNKENMNVGDMAIFLEEDIYLKQVKKSNKNKVLFTFMSVAAALAIFILPMFTSMSKDSYAVVSLDINPSIQIELDKDKNILDIDLINKDSKLLDIDNIEGKSLEEGLEIIKDELEIDGYELENNSVLVGFTFSTDEENEKYENEVKEILNNSLNGMKTIYIKGSKENLSKSESEKISLGRIEADKALDEDEVEDKIENMSVDEIIELLLKKDSLDEEIIEELEDELEDRIEETEDEDLDDMDNGEDLEDDEQEEIEEQQEYDEKDDDEDSDSDDKDDNEDDNEDRDEDVKVDYNLKEVEYEDDYESNNQDNEDEDSEDDSDEDDDE